MEEAREVWQDRSEWRYVVSAYTTGKRACRPVCKNRRRVWNGQLQNTSAELLLDRKPVPDCIRRWPKKVYGNSPCPLFARSKRVTVNKRTTHKTSVVRICQAPLDVEVATPYLRYAEIAKRLGAWQMVDRTACASAQYEPRDAERAGLRRAHMRQFDARVRDHYQEMRIMYDEP